MLVGGVYLLVGLVFGGLYVLVGGVYVLVGLVIFGRVYPRFLAPLSCLP